MEDTSNKETVIHPNPHVRFLINEELNAEIINNFMVRGVNRGGVDFGEIVLAAHPALADYIDLEKDERLKKVKDYVHEYYKDHIDAIEDGADDITKAWDDYSSQFFHEAKKVFPNTNWPEGKYIGYLSISPPMPRFLDSKTFCVIYRPPEKSIQTAAHEMHHFIFYEYVRQRYLPDMENTVQREMETRLKGKFRIPLWELSEVFNLIVLAGDEWGAGSRKLSASTYKRLVAMVPMVEKVWNESNHNIDDFFTRMEVRD